MFEKLKKKIASMDEQDKKHARIITFVLIFFIGMYGIQVYFLWGTTANNRAVEHPQIKAPVDKVIDK